MFPKTKEDYDGSVQMTLHILRNPWGWDDQAMYVVRSKAADMIEQLSATLVASMDAHERTGKRAYTYKDALERIALTTWSDDPCRGYVDIARTALKDD